MTTSLSAGRRHAPARLVLVRHGESVGNLADRDAQNRGAGRLDLDIRDPDVPLSDSGLEQARAIGAWIADLPDDERPTVLLSSPYRRALDTAKAALEALTGEHDEPPVDLVIDERLRERDLGAFDGMTGTGIREEYPEEAQRRKRIGKFYYRPPCGESWCDVALRIRACLNDIRQEYDGERVWLFSHQAVIMAFRLVLEGLDEQGILRIDTDTPLGNCSMTTYALGDNGTLELVDYADTSAVDRAPADVTHEPKGAGHGAEIS